MSKVVMASTRIKVKVRDKSSLMIYFHLVNSRIKDDHSICCHSDFTTDGDLPKS